MTNTDFGNVGERIATYRKLNGMTGDELAERAGNGVTRAVLANIETGRKKDISITHLTAIALALGVPLAALLFDVAHPVSDSAISLPPRESANDQSGELAVWQAIQWLSGDYEIGKDELTPAGTDAIVKILAFRNFKNAWGALQQAQDAVAAGHERQSAGEADPKDRAWTKYLEDSLADKRVLADELRGRLTDLGVEIGPWLP